MQFQVKGQDYFLEYIDEEHSWFVFTQTGDGLERIPVYVDGNGAKRNPKKQTGSQKIQ